MPYSLKGIVAIRFYTRQQMNWHRSLYSSLLSQIYVVTQLYVTFDYLSFYIYMDCVHLFTETQSYRGELASALFNVFPLQALNYIVVCISKLLGNILSCPLEKAELFSSDVNIL